jgi:hypothetical protein
LSRGIDIRLQRIFTPTLEQEIAEFRKRIPRLEYQSYLEKR